MQFFTGMAKNFKLPRNELGEVTDRIFSEINELVQTSDKKEGPLLPSHVLGYKTQR